MFALILSFIWVTIVLSREWKTKTIESRQKKKIKENKQNERVQKRVICIVDITCTRYTKKENEKMVFSTGRKKNSFFSSASFVWTYAILKRISCYRFTCKHSISCRLKTKKFYLSCIVYWNIKFISKRTLKKSQTNICWWAKRLICIYANVLQLHFNQKLIKSCFILVSI